MKVKKRLIDLIINSFRLLDDNTMLDGTTAAERICPWRRSSIPDDGKSTMVSTVHDPSVKTTPTSNNNDPHLRTTPLTSADFTGSFRKSPEYMGEYATTTKPEDNGSRRDVRDLFRGTSRTTEEEGENAAEDEQSTNL